MSTFGPYPGVVTREHDGDTVTVVVTVPRSSRARDVGWDVTVAGECEITVDARTFGDNAAELNTPAGKAALAYLVGLMPVGTPVQLLSHGWDKYQGRTDASISLPDGRDLVTVMEAAGQAAPWSGQGPKPVPA